VDKILVTSALPYANGPLHIGHVAGAYLPADIYVRYNKLQNNDVIFICGTDEHGAPISIKAEAEGVTPREIVDRYHKSIVESFAGLEIEFDNFSGTARPDHVELSAEFFLNLYKKDFIIQKTTQQWFDPKQKRFLADRYVEGICPFCKEPGARGDQCDSCGKLIDAVNLIEPVSKISGESPLLKETTHWYLELPKFEQELKDWLDTKTAWKDNVKNFIMGWLKEGLKERAITRDIDWGVPVPLENAAGKVLYVWFDAPIGYISSTIEWAKRIGDPDRWKKYWLESDTKLIHFLGKDNIPFHTIIWPAMLMKQDLPYVLPYDVPANEFLNLEGQKMSTSRNWTVWVNDFLKYFDGEYLRYYLAANAPESKDSDFYWKEFQNQINNDLANVLGNLANRVFAFSKKYFDGKITKPELSEISKNLLNETLARSEEISLSFKNYQVRKAIGQIMDLSRKGNKYFDETQPWVSVKEDKTKAMETLYTCAELLRIISILFYSVLPASMRKLRKMLGINEEFVWKDISRIVDNYTINEISTLFRKIDDKEINVQLDSLNKSQQTDPVLEHKPQIEFDDFAKMEFRVVKILEAEKIKKSNKLLKLLVDIAGEKRSVVAGIAKSYEPESLIGRKVLMLINLKPRKVMGVESQAMIMAAHDGEELAVMHPDKDIPSGSEVN
jgi:methionyl-tRNA synthetase